MSELDKIDGLNDKAKAIIRSLDSLGSDKTQMDYLAHSPTAINMLNRYADKNGTMNVVGSDKEVGYMYSNSPDSIGNINIGTEIVDGKNIYLTIDTIIHEVGHALGAHNKLVQNVKNNIQDVTLNEYVDAYNLTEVDAAVAQYQVFKENQKFRENNPQSDIGNMKSDFEIYHSKTKDKFEEIAKDYIEKTGKDPFLDRDFWEGNSTDKQKIIDTLKEFRGNLVPVSQKDVDEKDALTYSDISKINFLKEQVGLNFF